MTWRVIYLKGKFQSVSMQQELCDLLVKNSTIFNKLFRYFTILEYQYWFFKYQYWFYEYQYWFYWIIFTVLHCVDNVRIRGNMDQKKNHIRTFFTHFQSLYSNHLPYLTGKQIILNSPLTEINHNWISLNLVLRLSK